MLFRSLKTAAEITGNAAGKDAKQLKYVLAAEDVETQMRWEELIREQIWNASTNPNVRPCSPPAPPFPPSPSTKPTRPGSVLSPPFFPV